MYCFTVVGRLWLLLTIVHYMYCIGNVKPSYFLFNCFSEHNLMVSIPFLHKTLNLKIFQKVLKLSFVTHTVAWLILFCGQSLREVLWHLVLIIYKTSAHKPVVQTTIFVFILMATIFFCIVYDLSVGLNFYFSFFIKNHLWR